MFSISSYSKVFNTHSRCIRHIRFASSAAPNQKRKSHRINAWQIHSYGELSELQLSLARKPIISDPNELLIKVQAASLNPIDQAMIGGYGQTILNVLRQFELEFPLTLGRDFAGIVVDKGHAVDDEYNIGDEVYGIVPIHKQGSHAESVVVDKSNVCLRPVSLSATEAASIPYAALTAWGALYITGELMFRNPVSLLVLVLGGSGGVGTMAIQLLKSQGATVIATCSAEAIPLVTSLKADAAFDYRHQQFFSDIAAVGRYNIILDCANYGHKNIPDTWKYDKYITLNSPLLRNTDDYGLLGGLVASAGDLINSNIPNIVDGQTVRWGFFVPSNDGLKFIDRLVRKQLITPVIHKVFPFDKLPTAFETLAAGHLRGKIVISMSS